jgi:hypothetical protein
MSTYQGSTFNEVRAALRSDPYTGPLPHYNVTIGSMYKGGKNHLWPDSKWLLQQDDDLVPPMQKQFNALSICFFGKWKITEDLGYTGCFRAGTEHLIIVRCSNQLTTTDRGTRRGFGLAGKIFPTLDPDQRVKTVNFLTINDLAPLFIDHFTDVALTNEPPTSLTFGLVPAILVLTNILATFFLLDLPAIYRPIYALAEEGLKPGEVPRQPKWIQVTTDPSIGKSDAVDFRDELRVKNYKDGVLRFIVSVAPPPPSGKKRVWRPIGSIELNEDVCSYSGDHRIRFRHYPNRGHAVP